MSLSPPVRKIARRRVPGVPDPVDIHVGSRVRLRRTLLGLSQGNLGEAIGLTFQQIQKYERGLNRIGASRLFDISQVLDVPISFFFDDMPEQMVDRLEPNLGEDAPIAEEDLLAQRETLELVRVYYRVPDDLVRKRVLELVKSLAKMDLSD